MNGEIGGPERGLGSRETFNLGIICQIADVYISQDPLKLLPAMPQLFEQDDVMTMMTWKHFLYYWSFVRGIHRSLVDPPPKGPVMQNFNICFVVSAKRLLNKHWSCQWFWDVMKLTRHHCIPRTVHRVCCVLWWIGDGEFYSYFSGLIHWQWGNHNIALVPVKQPWRILVNGWFESIH